MSGSSKFYEDLAQRDIDAAHGDTDDPGYHLTRAGIYATLALVAATREASAAADLRVTA